MLLAEDKKKLESYVDKLIEGLKKETENLQKKIERMLQKCFNVNLPQKT